MPGMRSEEEILRAFEGLDKVPGSRQTRREPTEQSIKKRKKAFGESNGWDENPVIKTLNGVETELFTIGALAQALEKQIVTIRLWEKKGYIPIAPYRLRSKELNGKKVKGNRVYTRELIEITIEEFERRGLVGSARVEWSKLRELTGVLVHRWSEAVQATKESGNTSHP
jgi:hypothetical protein